MDDFDRSPGVALFFFLILSWTIFTYTPDSCFDLDTMHRQIIDATSFCYAVFYRTLPVLLVITSRRYHMSLEKNKGRRARAS